MIRRRTAAAALAVAVAFAAAAVVSATLVSRERLILRCQNDVCVARRRRTGKKKKKLSVVLPLFRGSLYVSLFSFHAVLGEQCEVSSLVESWERDDAV